MNILPILATIFGLVNGFSPIPQAIKIFKGKSAKDISIISYSLAFLGVFIWLLYGIQLNNLPIIMANSAGTLTLFIIIIGWFLYGR